jgi:PKD repeat protein
LSVTPVNVAKIPMAPPNGMQPQFIVTIQPTGARFDPPAPLQLPNVDGHPPGAQVEMYSFDHDLEEFVAIGLGTVSADGTVIASNAGVGVIKAGWHCGSQPGGSGCAASCPICQAPGSACSTCSANDGDVRVDSQDQFDDCQRPVCSNGSVVQVPDASDDPPDAIGNDCHKSTCAGPLAIDDTDLPVDICKICRNGDIVDAAPGDARLTDVRAVVEGIDEKWKLLRNGSATFEFTAHSTRVQCADVRYEWDFGDPFDPTPKSGQFVSHTYRSPDQYVVTLRVTCQTCSGQLTQADTAKVVALEIGHLAPAETVPTNPERTKLGVGEQVMLTTLPSVNVNWSVTGGGTLQPDPDCDPQACNANQVFHAGAVRSSPGIFISAPPMLESTLALEFSVIPPERLRWTRVAGTPLFNPGEAGASMTLRPILDPQDVSFAALEFREESGPAINMRGFFATLDPAVPMADGGMLHVAGTQYLRVDNAQHVASHGPFPRQGDRWPPGSYDLIIPNTYRISGETETHFLDSVSVHLDLDENGRVIMTKSQACVARENFSSDVSASFCIPEPPQ